MLRKYFLFIVSGLVLLADCIALYAWCSSYPSFTLREHLKLVSPLCLEITFFLILATACMLIAGAVKNGSLRHFPGQFDKKIWLCLGCIMAAGFILVVFVAPREHRIFYDEDIYVNIGQTIAMTKGSDSRYETGLGHMLSTSARRIIGQTGMCNDGRNEYGDYTCFRLEYNKEPNGWPYLLSIVFRLFGVSEQAAFFATNALFLVAILAVFFSSWLLFYDARAALFSALIFALTPQVLIWCNTVAVEPSAACMAAFAVLSALYYLRAGSAPALYFFFFVTAFAVQFRPESAMICAVSATLILCLKPSELKQGRLWLAVAVFMALMIPHLTHLFSVKDFDWGGSGPKFAWSYFWGGNFRVNSLFYFMNMRFPLFFAVLFFLGLAMKSPAAGSRQWREKAGILVWFLLFWGIFCFFYAGSYNYGADVRFSVLSAAPIALLAGSGAACLTAWLGKRVGRACIYIPAALIVFNFLSFMPYIRAITQEAWAARADHRYAQEMLKFLPEDSVVLTHNPNMFLAWGRNAAQASLATEHRPYFNDLFNRYKDGVYFHFNFWCNVDDPLQKSFCQNILTTFKCTQVAEYREKNYRYALYKVEK
ncbi:MAG: glycosyltransferase family 39 protein [Deltaproteobacteria bacterium]|nr:glycosyltransferase family 39 protein [Deltaproteobacteria bacterium]